MARIKRIATELQVKDKLLDYSGDAGTSGQLLSSTGTGTNWITFSGVTASNGSSGRAAFFTGSTTIEGSDNFYWDNSNARLGIGTTSPGSALHVAGNIGSTVTGLGVHMGVFNSSYGTIELVGTSGAYIDFTTSGTDHKGRILYDHTSNYFRLDTNGSEKMRITSAGNVGIGTTSPDRKFEVESTGTGEMCITGTTGSRLYFRPTSAYTAGGNFGIIVAGTSSSPYLSTMDFTGYHNGVNTIMTMKGDGKVGIGTTSPSTILDVRTSVNSLQVGRFWNSASGSSAHSAVRIASSANNANSARLEFSDSNYYTGTISADRVQGMVFRVEEDGASPTGIAERMRIAKTGNIGIGTTSPGVPLDVVGIVRTTTSFVGNASIVNQVTAGTSGGHIKFKNNDGVDRAIITDSGSLAIGTNTPENKLEVVGDLRIRNANGSNPTDAGSLIFAETGGAWGTNLYGFRINQVGDNNYLNFQSANLTTIKDILTLARDTAYVGIGTTSPARNLHIHENDSTLSYIQITNDTTGVGGGDGVSFGITSDEVAIWNNRENTDSSISTNNTERIRIKNNGKVGIGTNSPDHLLHVEFANTDTSFSGGGGGAWGSEGIRIENTSGTANTMAMLHFRNSDADIHIAGIRKGTDDSDLGFFFEGTQKVLFENDGSATFAGDVTVGGNLTITGDINTVSVTDLDVSDKTITVGVGQAENVSGGSGLKVSGPSTEPSILWDETNDTWDFNYGIDVAGNSNASGNVTANKIGINKSSPTGRLHINQTADNQGIIIESGSVQPEIEFRDTDTGDTFSIGHNRAASQLAIEVDGTDKYVFTDGGRLGIGTTSPGAALSAVTADSTVGIFKSTTDQTIIKIEDDDTIGYIGVKDNDIAIGGNSSMTADANFKIDVTTGTAAFGMSPFATDKFRIRQTFNTSSDASNNGLFIDYNASGTDALTSDRNAIALRVDMDSTATGGNQTQELSMYAGYFDVTDDGDANHLYGMYSQAIAKKTASNDNQSTVHAYKGLARAGHTAGQVNQIVGGEFIAQTDNNGGTVNDLVGIKGLIQNTGDAGQDVGNSRAALFKVDISPSSNDPVYTNVYGIDSEIEMDETTTIGSAFVNFARIDANQGTITNAYLYRGTYNVHSNATVTNKYGIYLDGSERNYIQGSMNLGGTGNYNIGVPLAVRATAENTAEVLTKIWDGGNFAFSIDRSSTNTDANTELYRLGLNYNNSGAKNGYIGFFRGSDGTNGYLTFGSSNTERMRILSNGDIAINRTSQIGDAKLSIQADTGEAVFAVQCNSNNTTTKLINVFNSSGTNVANITINNDSTPDMLFNVYDGSSAITEVLKLDSSQNATFAGSITSGNITATGSGNTALSVISTGGYSQLITQASDSERAYIFFKDTSGERARLYSSSSNDLIFNTGGGSTTALTLNNSGNATFAGHVKIAGSKYLEFSAMGKLINMDVSSWDSGQDEHNILYSGWESALGDYLSIKVAGNSTSSHGNLIIGDNGLWFGRMNTTDIAQATDSATNPHSGSGSNYFRVDNSGNATFAGNLMPSTDGGGSLGVGTGTNLRWGGLELQSGAGIQWQNGDARIIEGLVNNYSLSFQTYDGSTNSTALRLDGDNTATFAGNVNMSTGNSVFISGTSGLRLTHDGTNGHVISSTGQLKITNGDQDEDIVFRGNDGGSSFTALTLDMSEAGYATFNDTVEAPLLKGKNTLGATVYELGTSVGGLKLHPTGSQVKAGTGTKGDPTFTFTNDTNTGMYQDGADHIKFTAGGDDKLQINATSGLIKVIGNLEVTGNLIGGIPCLFNSNFQDLSGTTRRFVPFNSTTVNAVSSPTVVNYLVMPYAGRVKKVYFKRVAGTSGTGFNITMYIYKNGSLVTNSGGIAWPSGHQASWEPSSSHTFAAGDTIAIAFQKGTSGVTLGHVSVGLAVELTDYDI